MNINRYTVTILYILTLSLTGCQSIGESLGLKKATGQSIERAIDSINEQLTDNSYFTVADKSIVSSTFVWSDTLTTSTKSQDMQYLGTLLQESISTRLSQSGANMLEIKSANAIYLTATSELILSRDSKKISSNTMADYVLTGIMTPSEYGVIVNVKIIKLDNKQVASAARQVIVATNLQTNKQHSSVMKDGLLHRNNSTQGVSND